MYEKHEVVCVCEKVFNWSLEICVSIFFFFVTESNLGPSIFFIYRYL